jgi:hypothetical protein
MIPLLSQFLSPNDGFLRFDGELVESHGDLQQCGLRPEAEFCKYRTSRLDASACKPCADRD